MDTPVKGGFYRMEGGRDWEHEAGMKKLEKDRAERGPCQAEIVEKIVRRMRRPLGHWQSATTCFPSPRN